MLCPYNTFYWDSIFKLIESIENRDLIFVFLLQLETVELIILLFENKEIPREQHGDDLHVIIAN